MNKSIADRLRSRRTRPAASWQAWASDERGSATVIVALTMAGLIALLALGIDLGALFNARSEAQRAADAAALAGASAFLEFQQENVRSVAVERAMSFATSNSIRGRPIAPEDVTVAVNLDSATVQARVRRPQVPTWFARLFGVDAVDVGAEATAWAGAAGAAQCLKPFAVPDMWEERTHDANGNRIWDEGERWSFDPNTDRYAPFTGPGGSPDETGYGSSWRDGYPDAQGRRFTGDYGRRITIKVTNPGETWNPSFFLPWVIPPDPNQAQCGSGPPWGGPSGPGGGGGSGGGGGGGEDGGDAEGPGQGQGSGWFRWTERRGGLGAPSHGGGPDDPGGSGGSSPGGGGGSSPGGGGGSSPGGGGVGGGGGGQGQGAARYRQNICSCNNSVVDLDTEYLVEPGNMVGPTYQGVRALIDMDPDAYWDDRTNALVSRYGMDSPRVVTVGLFHPGEAQRPGRHHLRFNNFARMFIEEQESPTHPVTARFIGYTRGVSPAGGGAHTTGSLVRVLQLIR